MGGIILKVASIGSWDNAVISWRLLYNGEKEISDISEKTKPQGALLFLLPP